MTYERLPPLPEVDGEAALQEVVRRYLHAYGPATSAEFARWFLMHPPAARALFESLRDELEDVDVEGWRAWQLRGASPPETNHDGSILLVPQFDCYVVGCHPRAQLLPDSVPEVTSMGTAAPYAVLLVDGIVAGLWTRQKRGKRLHVRIGAFEPLGSAQQDQAADQAERIGQILHLAVEVEFGPVEPRAHL